MCKRIRISCVIVDDIDFTPMWWDGETTSVDLEPTDEIGDLVKEVRKKEPTLQQYDFVSFRVLRILRPVQTAAAGANASEVSKLPEKEDPLSLALQFEPGCARESASAVLLSTISTLRRWVGLGCGTQRLSLT